MSTKKEIAILEQAFALMEEAIAKALAAVGRKAKALRDAALLNLAQGTVNAKTAHPVNADLVASYELASEKLAILSPEETLEIADIISAD